MSKENVCKEGIVRAIHENSIDVEIIISSACSGCHAKSICMPSDQKQEIISAKSLYGETFEVGEKVELVLSNASANKAVIMAYVIPFLQLMITLVACYLIFHTELISVLVSLASVVIYYIILKKFNKKFDKEFAFFVKKHIE